MPQIDGLLGMPGPAYGDSIGAMTIAGGISAALYAREKTGETSVVDVSLLSAGAWANALAIDLSLLSGQAWVPNPPETTGGSVRNPLIGFFRTSDGRYLNLNMMQPGKYWPEVATVLGRPEWIDDPRFDTAQKLMDNAKEYAALVGAEIATRTFAEMVELLKPMDGQWAPVQDSVQVGQDPQLRANGFIAEVTDIDGIKRELVTAPVQFDEEPATLTRAPDFAEHTEEILKEVGRDDEQILNLRIAGAVT
jgi:crotonobetainyl-CoA:carnitine CoA-transferase CaiB-like acyl-CoA transferase